MKRSIIASILVLCLLLSTASVFAAEISSEKVISKQTQTLSEYDIIKKLQSKTDEELLDMGYEKDDILEIRKINFSKYVEELKAKTPAMLREQGYSEDEVNLIKRSNNEAEILTQTMGKVTYTVTAMSLKCENNITRLKAQFTWEWSSKPVVTLIDIVGMTTNKDFYRDETSSYNVTNITYYKNGNLTSPSRTRTEMQNTKESGTKVYTKIPMYVSYPSDTSDKDDIYYAMKGTMQVEMKESGVIYTTNVSGNYGHTIVSCDPSVAVSSSGGDVSGSISFTPKLFVESGVESTHSIDLQE